MDDTPDLEYSRFGRERIMILNHKKAKDLRMSLVLQNFPIPDLVGKSDLELLSTREELETRNKEAERNMVSKQIDFYKVDEVTEAERGDRGRRVLVWQVQKSAHFEFSETNEECR